MEFSYYGSPWLKMQTPLEWLKFADGKLVKNGQKWSKSILLTWADSNTLLNIKRIDKMSRKWNEFWEFSGKNRVLNFYQSKIFEDFHFKNNQNTGVM